MGVKEQTAECLTEKLGASTGARGTFGKRGRKKGGGSRASGKWIVAAEWGTPESRNHGRCGTKQGEENFLGGCECRDEAKGGGRENGALGSQMGKGL